MVVNGLAHDEWGLPTRKRTLASFPHLTDDRRTKNKSASGETAVVGARDWIIIVKSLKLTEDSGPGAKHYLRSAPGLAR